ncbi:hypothetical protein EJ04DRAFT_507763 [Polyplosphaeria fusca]|uniref:Protein SMG7 n=1 Tax=Polyplosphaeria fusca TaxID=682080 RepID=A0A9P4R823_9PLEO|nr:hypothetical protein EJ04DRAFT_507763 [Polyplosphaeria fusca]
MAATTEALFKRAQAIETDLLDRVDRNTSGAELTDLLTEYRVACQNVIFADFDYALTKGVQDHLWNTHSSVNGNFRKELKYLRRKPKEQIVALRKLSKSYLTFIKSSQKFYRQYILDLDAQFDGITELRKIAHTWKNEAPRNAPRKRLSSALKGKVLVSCYQTLIYLGDLSRYRETELVDKDRNWGPAVGYYDLARELYPDSGHAHNQLAVIAQADSNHFRSTYHLYRSLASLQPHPRARPNLELDFKKIVSAWEKGELISNHRSTSSNAPGRALVAWFIRLHSKLYKGTEFREHDELESEVLTQITIEIKEQALDSVLQKMILINMAAEYFATIQMQEPNPPENIMRTYFYYFRLNAKTFFVLLQIFQSELERLSEGDDVTQHGDRNPQLSDKITTVARRLLPGLRLYSTWLVRYWKVLESNMTKTLTEVEVQELWKAYAATLTLLASSFPAEQLPTDQYMLDEDVETLGFQPLVSPETMKVWYNGDVLKQKGTELDRKPPNVEMLMRVRDLMIDGLHLVQDEDAPLDLDTMRFIYREVGLPSELLASPHNRPDGSPAILAEPMDLPLIPAEAPIADDQKSHSVAAPSESASTTIAKDSAMTRMVDDLVGVDEGLDTLLEEDEDIPPTPPEQTFEDTTKIDDSTYGIGSVSITDFVNMVQNPKRPLGSPAAAPPLFSTPMGRTASTSSIRQLANLPSLPDGQSNGTSIWNRQYNGTPGPSSPFLGDANGARGSPLSAMRTPAHVRGDSANSLHSSEWTGRSGTPVQRPMSGGLSGGWGNPNMSFYGSIYGNAYNGYNGAPDSTDMNMMSPMLFGKGSSWNNGLDKDHSSYGRTPSNGQAG